MLNSVTDAQFNGSSFTTGTGSRKPAAAPIDPAIVNLRELTEKYAKLREDAKSNGNVEGQEKAQRSFTFYKLQLDQREPSLSPAEKDRLEEIFAQQCLRDSSRPDIGFLLGRGDIQGAYKLVLTMPDAEKEKALKYLQERGYSLPSEVV